VCVCVCVCVCDLETSTYRHPKSDLGFAPERKVLSYLLNCDYVKQTYIINSGNKVSRNKDHLKKTNRRRDDNITMDLRQIGLKKTMWSGFI
jgi:hypothetical protein